MVCLPWWPSWLDRGTLINVDAPGCVTSVDSRPDDCTIVPKGFLAETESALHQRGPLGRAVL